MADEKPTFANPRIQRVDDLLGGVTDGTLLVLKGHLLLEEILYTQVRANLPHPEHLDKANLGFYRLLCLARSMFSMPTDEEKQDQPTIDPWDLMEALNTLRNCLAHHIEPNDISPLLIRLKAADKAPATLNDEDVVIALGITIALTLGWAMALGAAKADGNERPIRNDQ